MKKHFLFLLILTLISYDYTLAQSATKLSMQADSLWNLGKNEQAIEYYTKAINLGFNNPKELSMHYDMRARCYRNLDRWDEKLINDSCYINTSMVFKFSNKRFGYS